MLVGALLGGVIADKWGRRPVFIAMSLAIACCGLASAASSHLWQLSLCRLGVGVGLGAAGAALSLYAEWLPADGRGGNLVLFFGFFSVGAVVQCGVAWACLTLLAPGVGWRVLLAVAALPALALCGVALCGTRYVCVCAHVHVCAREIERKCARVCMSVCDRKGQRQSVLCCVCLWGVCFCICLCISCCTCGWFLSLSYHS